MAMWPNLTGQTLGSRFRIGEKQPASLLWEVYKGIDTTNQKPVIIKLLPPGLAHNERFRARFINLWHTVKPLKNDNLLIPLLMGIEGDYAFSIVEPVNGITLRNYLKKLKTENRSIDIEEAQALMRQIAGALHSAHQAGVIHGDLNPDNVLLEKLAQPAPYRVRLTDFSLMKLIAIFDESGQAAQRNWAYVSPEHLSNMADVNAQSDIYLAGILFYETIAGQPPFSPTHHPDAVAKHTHEAPPDLRPYHAGISAKLEDIIYKCLEKKSEDRYQNANEIVSALQPTARVPAAPPPAVISPPPAPAPPPEPPPPAHTDDVIQVTIDPATMVVKVEQPKSVNLTVFNQSSLTDHFSIHLSGIPQEWYTVSSDPLRLNPGDRNTDTIAFKVPKSSSSTAGKHDVELRINPVKQKLQPKIITLSLVVEPFYEYTLDLEPTLLKRGKTLLTITNKSNDVNTYNLHASDPAHDLDFEMERAQVTLQPGDKVSIPVGIKAKQRPWLGSTQQKPFEIEVTSSKVQNPPPPQRGTLIVNPRIPRWVVMLVPLLLIAGVALAFFTASNIQNENATATAVAIAATDHADAQQASQTAQAAADSAATATAAAVQTASAHQTATAEWNKADPDDDGLSNQREAELGTDPQNPDSDEDGLTDGDEVDRYETKPRSPDSDNDRLSDGDEIEQATDPNVRDSDRDSILDGSDDCPNEGNLGTGVDNRGCPREATVRPTEPTPAPTGTTPQQAYEMYWYSVINDQNHNYGWSHQTRRFQTSNSLTFAGFAAWASQWQSVTVSNVNTICEENNLAVVRSLLIFTPASGGTRTTVNGHHQLQRDSNTGEWLFNSSDPGSFGCDQPVP